MAQRLRTIWKKTTKKTDYTVPIKHAQFDEQYNVAFQGPTFDPYNTIESHVTGKPTETLTDPLFINPCSYESVSVVFDHILTVSDREWVAVGCDGLPYILGSRVIQRYHTCSKCLEKLKSEDTFLQHCTDIHNMKDGDVNTTECKSYGKLLLIPGLGHYEMKYTKAIFKLLWPVCLGELAKMLGYRSIKALTYCEMASNHHKSWQILQIFLHGTAPELVLPYVRECLKHKIEPTVEGLYTHIEGVGNSNYIYLFKVVFTYLFALDLFRKVFGGIITKSLTVVCRNCPFSSTGLT